MFSNYYRNKRVLVTGHTGFKGAWLCTWLHSLGAKVYGIALEPSNEPNAYKVIGAGKFVDEQTIDIKNYQLVNQAIRSIQPEFVFHMAAQSLVRQSYATPIETLSTNVVGTANILESIRVNLINCPVLIITSDKCYDNKEWRYGYRETDRLGGHDVYSASKAMTELVTSSWHSAFFSSNCKLGPVATARAGNVIGGGDFAKDRIVPDIVRAFATNQTVKIRNPYAIRPWQHVLECLSGYLSLGNFLAKQGGESSRVFSFNFGPGSSSQHSVEKLVEEFKASWPGNWTDASDPNAPHEANTLTLCIDKAISTLNWQPILSFSDSVRLTADWYKKFYETNSSDIRAFTLSQISYFESVAVKKNLLWSKA